MIRKSVPRAVVLYALAVLVICMTGLISTPVSVYGDGGTGEPPTKPPTPQDSTLDVINPGEEDNAQNQVRAEAEPSFLEVLIVDAAIRILL
ncbi:MAG: hypothetical protein JSV52_06630 [Candidatus Zixiibacteriota bacterium]|nr:MAG: hypothetical protein JSV52_06630 [candidate division Zixibacteria bacterium]